MGNRKEYIIGIDTGGTFTDATVIDKGGNIYTDKAPTTPSDFSQGVLNAIEEVCKSIGITSQELLSRCRILKHGTTVATNALITKEGSKVGLIITKGFEDTTLIMRAIGRVAGLSEDEIKHQAAATKPEPLVPRNLIRGISERIDFRGNVLAPLNEKEVREALTYLIEEKNVEAIAVSFLWSFIKPIHERRVKQILEEMYPTKDIYISLSSELIPVIREYARTNTVIIDSFLGKTMKQYITTLSQKLAKNGYRKSLAVMQANGGIVDEKTMVPIGSLGSGPSGGMVATKFLADYLGHQNVIATDMGGTSFDVGLLYNGFWLYNMSPIVERFHITLTKIDVESIGAGGGTIARVDPVTRHLILGPQSAAADPGPACYGLKGNEPTITDADLILGILNPDNFWGRRMKLYKERAEKVIKEKIADPMKMDIYEASAAIYDIINQQMSDLIKRQVVRTGRVPEEFLIYAYGGMGPSHAVGYSSNLGIKKICVPSMSPVFSSFGISTADIIHSLSSSFRYLMPMNADKLNDFISGIENKLFDVMEKEGYTKKKVTFRRLFYLRYRRQLNELSIPVVVKIYNEEDIRAICDDFESMYESVYGIGSAYREAGIELISISIDAIGVAPKPKIMAHPHNGKNASGALLGKRDIFFTGDIMNFLSTKVYDLSRLTPGNILEGPAVVEGTNTTVLIPKNVTCEVDSYLNLIIEL